jgi:hypothetical protein
VIFGKVLFDYRCLVRKGYLLFKGLTSTHTYMDNNVVLYDIYVAILCYSMLCYVILCHVILCYIMLYHVMSKRILA